MKAYLLRRERVLHLVSLMLVVASVFVDEYLTKIGLVLLGILGLILISYAKDKKTTMLIYSVLFLAALVYGYYLGIQSGAIPDKL